MKNNAIIVLTAITLALVCVLLAFNFTKGITESDATQEVVSVFGQGKVSLKPDVAYLTFGYENIDLSPKIAQNINAENMNKIIKALKSQGIMDEEIQTSQYNVDQEYDYNGGDKKLLGYRVTNIINVKISDVDGVSNIINTAIDAGGNVFYGINFDVLDRQQAYLDAANVALERAKEKAQIFAQKEGMKIMGVLEINEGSATAQTYQRTAQSNYVALSYARDVGQAVMAADSTAISSGQVEITATVTVVYAMR